MWAAIVIIIVYAFFVFALFVDDPDFQWYKSKSGRIRAKLAKRLRNIFNKSDDKLDQGTGCFL